MINFLWENLFKGSLRNQKVEQILSTNFIFENLSYVERLFVQSLIHYRNYRPGEVIFQQGELGVGMYIIVKGNVNISVSEGSVPGQAAGADRFVTRLSEGDFFGEIALVEQTGRRTATAAAAGEVTVLGFFKPDLAEIIERSPRTGVKILARLAEVLGRRLKETADRFTELKREIQESQQPQGRN